MAKTNFFKGEMFVASKFSSAQEKADFANALMNFIESGFERHTFTRKLYERLSLTFGFLAHNDLQGFWQEYFTKTVDKAEFLAVILRAPCYGQPEHTYSDVEQAVKQRVRLMGFHDYYWAMVLREEEAEDRGALERLQVKYAEPPPVQHSPLVPQQAPLTVTLEPLAADGIQSDSINRPGELEDDLLVEIEEEAARNQMLLF